MEACLTTGKMKGLLKKTNTGSTEDDMNLIHLVEYFKIPSFIFQARDHLGCSIRRQNVVRSATKFLERLLSLEIEDTSTETRGLTEQRQERTTSCQELNEFIYKKRFQRFALQKVSVSFMKEVRYDKIV